ncbi:helix-turn-helix transcriptional regulator [Streptomyces sp. NPDC048278]|uniref:helix-turn-helix transcriptional regulator n=1 Tax=unclassified Streptomyces TaxID=2593676 RepID=UPI0034402A10
MTARDLDAWAQELYRAMSRNAGLGVPEAADLVRIPTARLGETQQRLIELGLLEPVQSTDTQEEACPVRYVTSTPEVSLARLMQRGEGMWNLIQREMEATHAAMSVVASEFTHTQAAKMQVIYADMITDRRRIEQMLSDAAESATDEILSVHTSVPNSVEALETGRARNRRAMERGVRMRTVHLASTARSSHGYTHLKALDTDGMQVRLLHHVPFRLLIVDDSFAVTPGVPDRGSSTVMMLRGREITRLLREVFEFCWLNSAPFGSANEPDVPEEESGTDSGQQPTAQQRVMLQMMSEGMKDESVSRKLGISVRTVGRMVNSLMVQLNVQTRYQLGVHAARMGWITGAGRGIEA